MCARKSTARPGGEAYPVAPLATPAPDPWLPSDRDASGRDLGEPELRLLAEALRTGHLNSTGGTFVPRLERAFADRHGVRHATACASGSAAIHAALGAIGLRPGDEVVTTPITDMGAILPIFYEGAVPVFADVDVETANITAETVARVLGPRTRAVIATHLFGQPCAMQPLRELACEHGFVLIEDAAQAFLATDSGQLVGSLGDIACFSFQQGKHMTTGEGGMVITDDPDLADGVRRFVNKGWGYGDARPDHDRPGLNYRLTELQAAVGIAQLEKLDGVVARRRTAAAALHEHLRELPGLSLPLPRPATEHSYWRYALRVDSDALPGGARGLAADLAAQGLPAAPHYVGKPAFDCAVLASASSRAVIANALRAAGREPGVPLGGRTTHPGAYAALERLLVLPWNEHFAPEHVDRIANVVREAIMHCTTVRANA
jgi:dTDP-4-amino-4,6-dideoxygalactose transaminase